jgi:uncharacterized protein (DUF1330 family)
MIVKAYGRNFEVEYTWEGEWNEETNERPNMVITSINFERREILKLIYNSPLYFEILERAVNQ